MENVKPKKEEPGRKEAQGFIEKYKKLCEEEGFQIIVIPAYKARDDGTWSTVLQTSVGRLPEQDKPQS